MGVHCPGKSPQVNSNISQQLKREAPLWGSAAQDQAGQPEPPEADSAHDKKENSYCSSCKTGAPEGFHELFVPFSIRKLSQYLIKIIIEKWFMRFKQGVKHKQWELGEM